MQIAHIIPWAQSFSHHPSNLIRICTVCHNEHDLHNSLSTKELFSLKQNLIERTKRNIYARLKIGNRFPIPPSCKKFIGRKDHLEQLKEYIGTSKSISILGLGGIGKSELIKHALNFQSNHKQTILSDVN